MQNIVVILIFKLSSLIFLFIALFNLHLALFFLRTVLSTDEGEQHKRHNPLVLNTLLKPQPQNKYGKFCASSVFFLFRVRIHQVLPQNLWTI